MARNFWGTKFPKISSKNICKNSRLNKNYIKPTITIHIFIICIRMVGDDIQMSFEVESMVCGYHCYSTMREELPCKLELNNPEDRFAVAMSVWDNCRPRAKKNIIDLVIISVEKRDDYLLSYRLKRTFCWPPTGSGDSLPTPFWREQQRYW